MSNLQALKEQYEKLGEEIEALENPLPSKWEDLTDQQAYDYLSIAETEDSFNSVWRLVPSRYKALRQLEILRDIYNDGWDRELSTIECSIYFSQGILSLYRGEKKGKSHFLNFKDIETRDLFLRNFEEFIVGAKELL